jgi:opacity protein-like surface antigen
MKRITALAFLTAALISMGSARAHAQVVKFNVPFDFVVENQVLPAGTYGVSQAGPKVILIRNQTGNSYAFITAYGADGRPGGDGMLIFNQYGKQYFLHEVLDSEMDMNLTVPTSKLEKRVRVEEAELARSQTVAALHVGEK